MVMRTYTPGEGVPQSSGRNSWRSGTRQQLVRIIELHVVHISSWVNKQWKKQSNLNDLRITSSEDEQQEKLYPSISAGYSWLRTNAGND